MSSTTKTTNYNLSQFADADKPTWRGDYNGDMLKIDRGMQCNANAASDAHTAAVHAQSTADSATAKAAENATKITQVKTTAESALSTAQTNATDIATNEGEFQAYKTSTDNQLAAFVQRLNALDTLVATKKTAAPEGYQVGSHVRCGHVSESSAISFAPGNSGHKVPYSELNGNGVDKWVRLSNGDIVIQPGTYMINLHTRVLNPNKGDRTFRQYVAIKPNGGNWTYPGDLYTDCYAADLGSSTPSQEGTMTFLWEFDVPSTIETRLQILGSGESVSAKIGPSVMYVTRQNDGSGATRSA